MIVAPRGRWPPVYDADGLQRAIRELVTAEDFDTRFWSLLGRDAPKVCQGDVVRLGSAVPVIDEEGTAVATDDCEIWLVTGNTCDFDRAVADVPWTQVVPIVEVERPPPQHLQPFRGYEYSRRFYLPPWPGGGDVHRFADFTRPVTTHKAVFDVVARVVARMQYPAWVLLHSCLIRFLARDDGRHDQAP